MFAKKFAMAMGAANSQHNMKVKKIVNPLIKNAVIPIIDTVFETYPTKDTTYYAAKASWMGIKATYGFAENMFGREAYDFMDEVNENIKPLTYALWSSTEFRQSILSTLDSLIRTRTAEKRRIIKAIYTRGYLKAEDKEKFELERLNTTANQISVDAVKHLQFIKKEIMPIHSELAQAEDQIPAEPKPNREWWLRRNLQRIKLSEAIQKYIYSEYGLNSPKKKVDEPDSKDRQAWDEWARKVGDEENEVRTEFLEYATELISLGIFSSNGGGYTWTRYGLSFLQYLDEPEKSKTYKKDGTK